MLITNQHSLLISKEVDKKWEEEQSGFRADIDTIDTIYILKL